MIEPKPLATIIVPKVAMKGGSLGGFAFQQTGGKQRTQGAGNCLPCRMKFILQNVIDRQQVAVEAAADALLNPAGDGLDFRRIHS